MNPPDALPPVQLLALSRLLVAGKKGVKRDPIRKDLEPLLGHRWSDGELTDRLDAILEELASAGLLDRTEQGKGKGKGKGKNKTPNFALTDAGRARTMEALGLETLPPKTNWGQMVAKYLAARALGLPAPTGAAAKTFGDLKRFKAAVLRSLHGLPVPALPTLAQATDAMLWKLLGRETADKFVLKAVKEYLILRSLGDGHPRPKRIDVEQLIVRDLQPRNSKPPELRAAAVRRWLDESLAGPKPHPTPPLAGTDGPTAASLPLDDFARRVVAAARTSPSGRFGENKVFIAHAWRALRDDPVFRGMDLDAFKGRLAEANRARHLDLSRADLVEAMDPDDVRTSETTHFGAHYHFIRF